MLIGFKDDKDGFYQCEVENENDVPEWAANMTRLTDDERVAELVRPYESTPV